MSIKLGEGTKLLVLLVGCANRAPVCQQLPAPVLNLPVPEAGAQSAVLLQRQRLNGGEGGPRTLRAQEEHLGQVPPAHRALFSLANRAQAEAALQAGRVVAGSYGIGPLGQRLQAHRAAGGVINVSGKRRFYGSASASMFSFISNRHCINNHFYLVWQSTEKIHWLGNEDTISQVSLSR